MFTSGSEPGSERGSERGPNGTERLLARDYLRAAELLAAGELVVIPTETVYGLAASAVDRSAVRAVFVAKDRPQDNPLIVHLGDTASALELVPRELGLTRTILAEFSPGPVTVILPAPPWAVPEVRGGLPTIALRVPSLELARQVILAAGVPVAAPSANRSGRPSPTTTAMALAEMDGRVAAVIDGGDCTVGIESTIVDARDDRQAIILRPGVVSAAEITRRVGCPARRGGEGDSHAPGTRYRHYTPHVPVVLVMSGDLDRACEEIRSVTGRAIPEDSSVAVLSMKDFGSTAVYAEGLYRAFWRAEVEGRALILAELPPETEPEAEGLADRLRRAAAATYRPGVLGELMRERIHREG